MPLPRLRRTLQSPSSRLEGIGLHSGVRVSVQVWPAPPGTGLMFRDAQTGQEAPALAVNVQDTSRCTRLGVGGMSVQTVEHLLSALAGLGIDDAVLETRGGEIPILDGSAAPFVVALRAAGLCDQAREPSVAGLRPTRPLLIEGAGGSVIALKPSDVFSAAVFLDYPRHAYLGTLCTHFDAAADDYAADIAPARTFGFLTEVEALRARGLALGASRENAVALGDDDYETPLRFPDELARHKLLDLIGDLALLGQPLRAEIFAIKPSHTLNIRLARALSDEGAS
jgi:UDP-3-O-[3-hydroxymyristoyl] N-acetylglucosamine deacetylase